MAWKPMESKSKRKTKWVGSIEFFCKLVPIGEKSGRSNASVIYEAACLTEKSFLARHLRILCCFHLLWHVALLLRYCVLFATKWFAGTKKQEVKFYWKCCQVFGFRPGRTFALFGSMGVSLWFDAQSVSDFRGSEIVSGEYSRRPRHWGRSVAKGKAGWR